MRIKAVELFRWKQNHTLVAADLCIEILLLIIVTRSHISCAPIDNRRRVTYTAVPRRSCHNNFSQLSVLSGVCRPTQYSESQALRSQAGASFNQSVNQLCRLLDHFPGFRRGKVSVVVFLIIYFLVFQFRAVDYSGYLSAFEGTLTLSPLSSHSMGFPDPELPDTTLFVTVFSRNFQAGISALREL